VIYDRCGIDKAVTVTITFTLIRINLRSGEESREVHSSRLCCACGGAEPPPDREVDQLATSVEARAGRQ
jgi:hypothetical protein